MVVGWEILWRILVLMVVSPILFWLMVWILALARKFLPWPERKE